MYNLEHKNINYSSMFYVLLLSGYVLISGLPYFFSVESIVFTIPFRAVVLCVSLLIIGYNFYFKENFKFDRSDFFYILFWIVYLVNVYLSFNNYQFSNYFKAKEAEVYMRIIGVCFIPSLAILTIKPISINYKLIFKIVYAILFIILLLNILIGIEYNFQGRSSGILATYSINFGHLGVTLVIMSVYNYLINSGTSKWVDLVMLLGFLIGTYILYASGTRGPLISYVFVIGYILYIKRKFKFLAFLFFIIVIAVALLIFLDLQYQQNTGNSFFSRLTRMIVSGDSSGRGQIYRDSINVFLQKPIFGGRFLFFDGLYAHNLFLDLLMATGLFGTLIYFVFFKNCMQVILNLNEKIKSNPEIIWIPLVLIQYFTFAFFSCGIFDTPEIWYLIAMTMVIYKSENKISI